MKRKYTAVLLTAVMCVSLLAGCSSEEAVTTGTIYGQITAVDADAGTITIDVGTVESESGDAAGSADDTTMITLTGESQTVMVTDDTTMTSRAVTMGGDDEMSGGMGDAQGGAIDGSGDSSIPEGSGDGEAPSDAGTTAPEDAGEGSGGDGEVPSDVGEVPSDADGTAPDGNISDGSIPDDIPSDAGDGGMQDGQAPDDAAGGNDAVGGGMPDDAVSGDFDGTIPDADSGTGDFSGSMPENSASGDASADFEGSETEITIDDLSEGDIISVTYDDDGNVSEIVLLYDSDAAGGMEDSGQSASGDVEYTALTELTEDTTLEDETYASTGTDEIAILVRSSITAYLTDLIISRDSDDSTGGDNSSFYGVGAAVLTTLGTTYISDSTITTDAAGGAGIFSYGDGVTYVSDTAITTQQDTSGGIHVAGGGTLYAWDLTVETNGESSAAIRSDRGSGTMVVDGGSYTSNGNGSPAVYSTAEIAVHDAELTANGSEAVCIEGLNSVYLFDCDLTGNMADDSQNDTTWTVTLYQSQSGDSEEGNSTFQMIGGTLTSENGGLFYTTNTESTFLLEDVEITASDDCEFFLMCTGNANERGWGSSGSNGADCSFTAIDQEMEGDVIWDSISQLDFYITEDSTLTGAVINDETYAGSGGNGYCSIYIDEESTWIVTGDSTVTNLYNAGTITDASGKTVSIVGTDGTTYVSGSSSYTITVETYNSSVDLSGASTAASWSDFEVEKPDALN